MRIITHPNNEHYADRIMEQLRRKSPKPIGQPPDVLKFGIPLDIEYSSLMAVEEATGRIIAPDGEVTPRTGWSWQWDRFTVLDEDDLPWLLTLGVVAEEMQPVVYVMDETRLRMDYGLPSLMSPRSFVMGHGSA